MQARDAPNVAPLLQALGENMYHLEKQTLPQNLAGSMIFFIDTKSKEKLGPKTGCNQTGIFISDRDIIFVRKRKVQKIDVDELKRSKVIIQKHKDNSLIPKIINYFNNINDNYRMFGLGIRALASENFEAFNSEKIMPSFNKYSSKFEYEAAWSELISKLRKGDLIFIFNRNSWISKLIATMDNGSWSHCGIYVGEGNILETIPIGTVVRNIEIYKNKKIHFGVYRSETETPSLIGETINKLISEEVGPGYGYLKAIILGIRTVFGLNDDKFSPTDVTPNGLIYSGSLYLIGYI